MLPPIVHGVKIKWDWNGCTNSDKIVGLCASFWDYLPLLFQSQVFHSTLGFNCQIIHKSTLKNFTVSGTRTPRF